MVPSESAPEAPTRARPVLVVVAWLLCSIVLRVALESTAAALIIGIALARGHSLAELGDPDVIEASMSATLLGAVSLVQILALGGLALVFARVLDRDLRAVFAWKLPSWLAFGLGAVGGLTVGFFPGWVAQTLSERVPWLDLGNLEMINDLLGSATWVGKLVMLVAIAVAAPIVEELIFRGFLWSALQRAMPMWAVWLVTSGLFALYHVDPVHVIAVFFTGLFLGWVRWMTDSIWPSIGAHFANNALAAVVVLFAPTVEEASEAGGPALVSVVVSIALGATLWALRAREADPSAA